MAKYKLINTAESNRDTLINIVENFRPFAKAEGQEPVVLVEGAIDVLTALMAKAEKGQPLASEASLTKLAALLAGIQQLSDPKTSGVLTDPDDIAAKKSIQLMAPTQQGARYMQPVINWAMVSAKANVDEWLNKITRYEQSQDPTMIARDLGMLRQKLQMAVAPQKMQGTPNLTTAASVA